LDKLDEDSYEQIPFFPHPRAFGEHETLLVCICGVYWTEKYIIHHNSTVYTLHYLQGIMHKQEEQGEEPGRHP